MSKLNALFEIRGELHRHPLLTFLEKNSAECAEREVRRPEDVLGYGAAGI